ncbi:MAG TPA: hypothetical protein VGI41_04470 [Candidatus Udaeobacter sp.]|jgi:hypothetical protein
MTASTIDPRAVALICAQLTVVLIAASAVMSVLATLNYQLSTASAAQLRRATAGN